MAFQGMNWASYQQNSGTFCPLRGPDEANGGSASNPGSGCTDNEGKGARKGKEKEATWPAETSSVKPPRKKRKWNSKLKEGAEIGPTAIGPINRSRGGGGWGVQPPSGESEVDITEFRHAHLLLGAAKSDMMPAYVHGARPI
ncbi:hypothetical protein B0H17DRAFT_1151691 [Mycena rosella]|uniref:Uncharacterized protein n=1 Tax=Mycena rosella TaxID=1033263 RepID=A0AAD7FFW4_MYCRO|nr:hypothetical protein B0H17DRAFT_1151691 [Mycena rosella]